MDRPKAIQTQFAFFEVFLEFCERSANTFKNYRCDFAGFARWFEETNDEVYEPNLITPTDLREFKRYLQVQKKAKPGTINRKLASLRSFLAWAGRVGELDGDHIPRISKAVREEKRGPRWLARREKNSLLRAVERGSKDRDIAIVKIVLNTGLRVQELCDLQWADVLMSDRKGKAVVRHGKGEKWRELPLNKDARLALQRLEYESHAGEETPIFMGQRGPMTPRGVQLMLAKYTKASDLEGVSPHSLRHTFCKDLINADVGLEQVAALAGHESLETTRRYVEPSMKDLEAAVGRISEKE